MKEVFKRCVHCKSVYTYQMSGHGDYTYNNDTYCSDCYKVILEALKSVDVKFEKVKLPATNISVKDFEVKYKEHDDEIKGALYGLVCRRLRYGTPENFTYKDLMIDGVEYTLITNVNTNEKLLEVEYEQDCSTKKLIGLWNEYR